MFCFLHYIKLHVSVVGESAQILLMKPCQSISSVNYLKVTEVSGTIHVPINRV